MSQDRPDLAGVGERLRGWHFRFTQDYWRTIHLSSKMTRIIYDAHINSPTQSHSSALGTVDPRLCSVGSTSTTSTISCGTAAPRSEDVLLSFRRQDIMMMTCSPAHHSTWVGGVLAHLIGPVF